LPQLSHFRALFSWFPLSKAKGIKQITVKFGLLS